MYTLLDRYIFRELLSPFGISLAALCFIIFTKEMLRLVELLVSKGVGFGSVLTIIVHLMPSFLVLTLPIACLISTVTTFGRLSFDKELVAMRAAGLSLLRISVPVMAFSFIIFALTLYLSQWGQPWSNISLKKLAISLIQDRMTFALENGVFNEPIKGMMVYVPEPEGTKKPTGIFISDQRDADRPMVITADHFGLIQDPLQKQTGIRLYNGTIHQIPQNLTQHHEIAFSTYDVKIDFAAALEITKEERPEYDEILTTLNASQWRDTGALRRLMEYYKDWAFPIASLLLGVLGLPVGIVSKRSGRMGGFTIGIIVMIGYYLLNVVGEFGVTTLVLHPFAGAWFPNVALLIITISLFYRESRR